MSEFGRHDGGSRGVSETSSPAATDISLSSAGDELVEVTLDIEDDDRIILRSVEPATAFSIDYEAGNAASETQASTSRSPTLRRSSSRLRQFSQELNTRAKHFSQELKNLKRFSFRLSRSTSQSAPQTAGGALESAIAARAQRKQVADKLKRSKSGAHRAIRGLRFISGNSKTIDWKKVEENFKEMSKDGYLHRSDFAVCIGMKDSKEFALEMFDALSRRRRLKIDKLSIGELQEYWSQITDQSFDSRLQIFFDMVDKNEDGRLNEAEVKEIITLSASANKLSRLKQQAGEYAALIMEELDPEGLGYIEVMGGPSPLIFSH